MAECKCPFYKIDLVAQEADDEMESEYRTSLSEARFAAWEALVAGQAEDEVCDPLPQCGAYCRHFGSNNGYPGEYVYHCTAPGNAHIIHVDFNG